MIEWTKRTAMHRLCHFVRFFHLCIMFFHEQFCERGFLLLRLISLPAITFLPIPRSLQAVSLLLVTWELKILPKKQGKEQVIWLRRQAVIIWVREPFPMCFLSRNNTPYQQEYFLTKCQSYPSDQSQQRLTLSLANESSKRKLFEA